MFKLVQESTGKVCYKVGKTYACFSKNTIHPLIKESREEVEALAKRIEEMTKGYGTILIVEVGSEAPVVTQKAPAPKKVSKPKIENSNTNPMAIHSLCAKCNRNCKQRAEACLYDCPLFEEIELDEAV